MNLAETIRCIMYKEKFVKEHKAQDEQRNQRGIGLIAAAAFMLMSVLNIKEESFMMLATTSISALFLIIGYFVSRYKNYSVFLRVVFYVIFIVIFTSYTILGGNEGFAVLWLIIATYAVMIVIDFKAGVVISLYYLAMLLLVFSGPLSVVLQYDYSKTFLLRFPFLYGINFAFATYIVVRIRGYQYELLMKQQELEYLNTVDLSTGLMNRNSFIQYEQSFQCCNLKTLVGVYIDLNGLHEINNCKGHDAGDKMLCVIAGLCKEYFPKALVYRMGGDEFLIVSENVEKKEALRTAQSLFHAVEAAGYSISYGVEVQEADFDLQKLVKSADAKMVEYKKEFYRLNNRRER